MFLILYRVKALRNTVGDCCWLLQCYRLFFQNRLLESILGPENAVVQEIVGAVPILVSGLVTSTHNSIFIKLVTRMN